MDETDTLLEFAVKKAIQENPSQKELPWSEGEIRFLRENHTRLLDFEISAALCRTELAVKIFRVRQGLAAPMRAKLDWVSSNEAAKMLGVEVHAMTWWCDHGLIPISMNGPHRFVRVIKISDLTSWVVNPDNWLYFDWHRIKDEHLRRLCELRQQRWGDEWWNTNQVARYHGVNVKDVSRYIKMGRITTARQTSISKGGRHPTERRWAYYFIRKSEAVALNFIRRGNDMARFTPRADAWVLKARDQLHMKWEVIGRMMGSRRKGKRGKCGETVKHRYLYLQALIGMAEDWAYSLKYGG